MEGTLSARKFPTQLQLGIAELGKGGRARGIKVGPGRKGRSRQKGKEGEGGGEGDLR